MRRGLVLTCLWVLGVSASVGLAFAAVGRVANRVAPPGVAKLSSQAVDRALSSTVPSSSPTTPRGPSSSTTSTTTTGGSPTSTATTGPTGSSGPSGSSGPTSTLGTEPPSTNGSSGPATTVEPPPPTTTTPPTTAGPTNTVTTSAGGTVWTRCSGNEQIVYIAAVPRSGYERTRDVENPSGVVQVFENGSHRSTISAECSNGVVHAQVEEEHEGADFAPPSEDVQSPM